VATIDVTFVDLDDLRPYERNARVHDDAQVAEIEASIRAFGWTNPILADLSEDGLLIAGHGRTLAARRIYASGARITLPDGREIPERTVPVIDCAGWSEERRRAYTLADNRIAENAEWDDDLLRIELSFLQAEGFDLALTGFDTKALDRLLGEDEPTDPNVIPDVEPETVTVAGDVWILGPHRVMCGDSTIPEDVGRLLDGARPLLLHADPPYGMGKAADGVENDNLYRERLDAFQMAWWRAFRPLIADNASVYIWGNAPDLWRLWYAGGLGTSERFEFRNEIVWDKKSIAGMASPLLTQYPITTERALFFQIGAQFIGNINTEDFPEEWEAVRSYLEGEAVRAGIDRSAVKRVCGCGMYSHWFTRSQFTLIPEKHYEALAAAYPGAFARPWADVKAEWDRVKNAGRRFINDRHADVRSYFDNAHDTMRDVWEFPRVTGEERHGHATPKPVEMMERVMRSSLPEGGLCVEPFGGSGSTLIGAEKAGRVCHAMELQPGYVDVIVRRWQAFTGRTAVLEKDGRSFAEVQAARVG
jgi:DNA modification methylase